MKPQKYMQRWENLKQQNQINVDTLEHLSKQIALSFLDKYFYNDLYEREYINILCDMATFSNDDNLNKIGSSALFGMIIEGLCDDFEELQTETYNHVMSDIISFCRKLPKGKFLDENLNKFDLRSDKDILHRIENIRKTSSSYKKLDAIPKNIIILSRVTIGADVAITSVIVQKMKIIFPDSDIVVVGNNKLHDIFGADKDVEVAVMTYTRRGGLVERLSSWHAVLDIINETMKDLNEEDILLIDPDSRLSQLGVLPMITDSQYRFFNSRGDSSYPKKMSISELTNYWLDKVLGENPFCYPKILTNQKDAEKSANLAKNLRNNGCENIISINFGVGGNSRKMLTSQFEIKLILSLLREPNTVILLDKGFGDEELSRSNQILNTVKKESFKVVDTQFNDINNIDMSSGLIGIASGIGEAATLIQQSNEFIGYDSACQHIAAALGIITYTIFAGSNNPRFVKRWNATGENKTEIIHVDTLTNPSLFNDDDILSRINDLRTN